MRTKLPVVPIILDEGRKQSIDPTVCVFLESDTRLTGPSDTAIQRVYDLGMLLNMLRVPKIDLPGYRRM